MVLKDLLIAGLADDEIKREALGWADLDDTSLEDTVKFLEAKEMARDALLRQSSTNALVSNYKKSKNEAVKPKTKVSCKGCGIEIERFVWNKRQNKNIECDRCLPCWKVANPKEKKKPEKQEATPKKADETSALIIGEISNQPDTKCESLYIGAMSSVEPAEEDIPEPSSESLPPEIDMSSNNIGEDIGTEIPDTSISEVGAIPDVTDTSYPTTEVGEVILDHHIFDSSDGWKKAESMAHPTLRLQMSIDPSDYASLNIPCPQVPPSDVSTVSDTGAQSCLWGLIEFYRCGFRDSDLRPVRRTILAANREEIEIVGAILLRLTGTADDGTTHTARVMVYVSPNTRKFYLSREALIQLKVIPPDFPKVGSAGEASEMLACAITKDSTAPCGCPIRRLPPGLPEKLPFQPCPENIGRMEEWILDRYKDSTLNQCTHQALRGITGPELKLHVDETRNPKPAHLPAVIPLHFQEAVKQQLDANCRMGVMEKVPYDQPSKYCHRLVVRRKADGTPRLTVDMSSLNKACQRETHHVEPPFHQARCVPPNTWKTVTDARHGFHSVPLREEDRHYTTFITQWGRYRYLVAPQGSNVSGDAFNRRYDEIIADVERIKKCTDDTIKWDTDIEAHWWRVLEYIELVGRNGVVLNPGKLQFCKRDVDFAGFHIADNTVKPLDKYLRAIAEFPTPNSITDIRAWFGLVHQVSHYNKLTEMLAPFKPFLSPKTKFQWTNELNDAFNSSNSEIIQAIKEGVEIFDPNRWTSLRPDWSKKGIGYFLSQKHCECDSNIPGCCEHGWRITHAPDLGSRNLQK